MTDLEALKDKLSGELAELGKKNAIESVAIKRGSRRAEEEVAANAKKMAAIEAELKQISDDEKEERRLTRQVAVDKINVQINAACAYHEKLEEVGKEVISAIASLADVVDKFESIHESARKAAPTDYQSLSAYDVPLGDVDTYRAVIGAMMANHGLGSVMFYDQPQKDASLLSTIERRVNRAVTRMGEILKREEKKFDDLEMRGRV